MKMPKVLYTILVCVLNIIVICTSSWVSAQEITQQTYRGVVREVETEGNFKKYKIEIRNGDLRGRTVDLTQDATYAEISDYETGDKVFLASLYDHTSQETAFYISDYDRTDALKWLFFIFAAVVIAVSRRWGISSLIGMGYSFFIIFKFILPLLLKGYTPILIAIIGALLIAPVTFYLSHGINKKTTMALLSTLLTLGFTGLVSMLFINIAKLSGFGSEEAFFLQVAKEGVINVQGLLLAGIIIGTLGILDDVTISQSAIVFQLNKSVPHLKPQDLFKRAMEIGHDHIASTVNTLVLVYTGAALPLLLLFLNSSRTFLEAANTQLIAEEIVRTLVGSIGIVLAVPISTILAVLSLQKHENREV